MPMRLAPAAVIALIMLVQAALLPAVGHATKPGDRAPDFSLRALDGSTVKLSSLKGSIVVLDFWASWCVPCKKELPALDGLARRWNGKPVVVVAITVDKERAKAEKLLGSLKVVSLKVLLDPDGKVAAAYDLPTMPSSFVIDAKGLVKNVHSGFASGDEKKIAAEVEALLK